MGGPNTSVYAFSTSRPDQSPLVGPMQYGPQPLLRDPLDAARSLLTRDPDAQYPSGYVDASLTSRRSNPTSTSLWNTKPYDRGVHAATKMDRAAYVWPEEFNLASGIVNQATTGLRYVAPGIAWGEPNLLINGGKPGPRDSAIQADPNYPLAAQSRDVQAQMLRPLAPPWR